MTNLAGLAPPPSGARPKKSFLSIELTATRVKRDELMHLSRQLGAFVRAGLPIIEAVRILSEEAKNPTVHRVMSDIETGLRRGERLSDCMDRHPKVFPDYYRGIMRSAELTGQLDVVLEQLARYLERDLEARRKISSALIYPTVIAAMSMVTVVVMAVFVLPKFKTFFADLDAELPLATRILLAVTDFFSEYWLFVLGGIVLLFLTGFLATRSEGGRHMRDKFVLRLPLIGPTIRFALVERFCRVLSSMASAGVALPEALRVATQSLRNLVFTRALGNVSDAMMRGEGLSRPLAATALFPATAARMIRVGEETGTLDAQLEVTARYYEGELDYRLKRLTAYFEPAVIIVMGGIVGFVAIAMVSAMYGIFGQVQ